MSAFAWIVTPDRRLLRRLVQLLRSRDERSTYCVAGEALANALLASRPEPLSADAEQLADAMVGSLLIVHAATADAEDADRRVRLAMSAAVVAAARPHTATACADAMSVWIGTGIGSPRRHESGYALAARVLLSLWIGDVDTAAVAVDALLDIDRTGVAGVLHDWVVARVQGHGVERESRCFDHLRLSLSQSPGGGHGAALIVLAAAVVVRRAGLPMRDIAAWLDQAAHVEIIDAPERRQMVH